MAKCDFCGNPLTEAQYLLFNDNVYKSCPDCSKQNGEHIHYFCPDFFGTTPKRVTVNNPMGLQSHCVKCRASKKGPHNEALPCSKVKEEGGYIISEIRFLPMGKSVFSKYDDVKLFIENTLPNREGVYYFKTNQMVCPKNTFVLFQYDGKLVGYAVYVETITFEKPLVREGGEYNGYYQFVVDSIVVLDTPITREDIQSIDSEFKRFGEGAQKKPVGLLPAIFEIIKGKCKRTQIVKQSLDIPEEIEEKDLGKLVEGAKKQIIVNAYERNTQARRVCINHYRKKNNGKLKCEICGFDFGAFYGEKFAEKIHIHHIVEISSVGAEYEIDAVKDLIPICPNCHMVIHSKKPAYTPEEIKEMLK